MILMINTICFFFLLLLSTEVFAFNLQRCREGNPPKEGEVILERNLLVNITGTFTSSTEYVSSTGNCAAIGSVEEKRELFFAYNYKFIMQDMARGGGDNLNAFLSLFNCTDSQQHELEIRFMNQLEYFLNDWDQAKTKIFEHSRSVCS
jgi:hypothetical protein